MADDNDDPTAASEAAKVAINTASTLNNEALLADMERQYLAIKAERDTLLSSSTSQQSQIASLLNNVAEMSSTLSSRELELGISKRIAEERGSRVTGIEEELRNEKERRARIEIEADSLREEISRVTKANTHLSSNLVELETTSNLSSTSVAPLRYELQSLRSEYDALQAHSTWLESELATQHEQLAALKTSHSSTLLSLRTQITSLQMEREEATSTITSLTTRFHAAQTKLASVQEELFSKETSHADEVQAMEEELSMERNLLSLNKENAMRISEKYNDAIREISTLKGLAKVAVDESKVQAESLKLEYEKETHLALEDMERKHMEEVKDMEERIAELDEQRKQLENNFMDRGSVLTPLRKRHLRIRQSDEGDANEEEEDQDEEPMSLTDLYTRLAESEEELHAEKTERRRLELYLQRIQLDIESKGPMLRRQRKEYEIAMSKMDEMKSRLKEALEEKQLAVEEAERWEREGRILEKEIRIFKGENVDLASQVQALLRKSMSGSGSGKENQTSYSIGMDDIEDFVEFGSIEEIQIQNQRLLKEHRRLNILVSELKEKLESDTVQIKLRKAEGELNDLRDQRDRQATLVAGVVQQRDLYRAILAKNDVQLLAAAGETGTSFMAVKDQSDKLLDAENQNKELRDELYKLRAELSSVLNGKTGLEERLSRLDAHATDLTSSVDKLQSQLSAACGASARSDANATFHKEKCLRLEDSLQVAREEASQAGNSRKDLQRANEELHSALSDARTEAHKHEQSCHQALAKSRLAEAQVQMVRASESRLATEATSLRSELAKQGALLESMQRIEASISARSTEDRERLDDEVKRQNQVIKSERSQHTILVERLEYQIAELSDNVKTLESKMAEATAEIISAKDDLIHTQNKEQVLLEKCSVLEKSLNDAKVRLGDVDADTSDRDSLERVKAELEATQSELSMAKARVEDYRDIAKANEVALADLTKSTNEFKTVKLAEIETLREDLSRSKHKAQVTQEALEEITQDLTRGKRDQEKVVYDLNARIEVLTLELLDAKKDAEFANARVDALSNEVASYKLDAKAANDNYDRELALHVSSRNALRSALAETESEARLRQAAELQFDTIKAEVFTEKTSWEEEKSKLEDALKEFETRLKEVREQNNILHDQMNTLTETLSKHQTAKISALTESADDDATTGTEPHEVAAMYKSMSELREVVRFLRSERDMFESQMQLARRSAERERASSEIAKKRLREARDELQILQTRDFSDAGDNTDSLTTVRAEHNLKLKKAEEQIVLLRESNKLLREEAEKVRFALASSEKEIDNVKKAFEPADQKCRELEIDKSALEAEKASLIREVEAWKSRVQSLVTKFYQVDPEDHKKALADVEAAKNECVALKGMKEQAEKECAGAKSVVARLNKEISQYKSLLESTKSSLAKMTSEKEAASKSNSAASSSIIKERDDLKTTSTTLETQLSASKTEIVAANKRVENLTTMLRKYKSAMDDMKKKNQELVDNEQEAQRALAKEQETVREQREALMKAQKQVETAVAPPVVVLGNSTSVTPALAPASSVHVGLTATPPAAPPRIEEPLVVAPVSAPALDSKKIASGVTFGVDSEVSSQKIPALKPDENELPKIPPGGFKFAPSPSIAIDSTAQSSLNEASVPPSEPAPRPSLMSDDRATTLLEMAQKSDTGTAATDGTTTPAGDGLSSATPKEAAQIRSAEPVAVDEDSTGAALSTTADIEKDKEANPVAFKGAQKATEETALRAKLMRRKRELEAAIGKSEKTEEEKYSLQPPTKRLDTGVGQEKSETLKDVDLENDPATNRATTSAPGFLTTFDPVEHEKPASAADFASQPSQSEQMELAETSTEVKDSATDVASVESPTLLSAPARASTLPVVESGTGSAFESGAITLHQSGLNAQATAFSPQVGGFGNSPFQPRKTLEAPQGFAAKAASGANAAPAFGGGGAFLNLQPPGSGVAQPLVFGSSKTITLPMPSKTSQVGPATPSFGIFGNPLGGHGSASIPPKSIFGDSSTMKQSFQAGDIEASYVKLSRVDEDREDGEIAEKSDEPDFEDENVSGFEQN